MNLREKIKQRKRKRRSVCLCLVCSARIRSSCSVHTASCLSFQADVKKNDANFFLSLLKNQRRVQCSFTVNRSVHSPSLTHRRESKRTIKILNPNFCRHQLLLLYFVYGCCASGRLSLSLQDSFIVIY